MVSRFFRTGAILLMINVGFGAGEPGAPAKTALPEFIQGLLARAEAQDRDAQRELGYAYMHGEEVAVDPLEAASWLMKSYTLQATPAVEEMLIELAQKNPGLNERYIAKYGSPEVQALAAKAKAGDRAAQVDMAIRLNTGDGVLLDYDRPKETLRALSRQGYAPAQYQLYQLTAATEDEAEANQWLEKAVAQNYAPALFQVATNLQWSEDEAERKRGRALLEKAAGAGYGHAMLFLARDYRDAENDAKALEWGRRALDVDEEGAKEFVTELLAVMKAKQEPPQVVEKSTPAPTASSAPVAKPAPPAAPSVAPKTAALPTASPSPAVQPSKPAPAPMAPPVLATNAKGELIVPALTRVTSPAALQRAWRESLAGALSIGDPTLVRARGLFVYATGLAASEVSPDNQAKLLRERIDLLALTDFYALYALLGMFPANQGAEFSQKYFTEAQRTEVQEIAKSPATARFPAGLGWAEPDLKEAQRALAAKQFPGYLAALQRAAEKGSPEAMVSLAEAYRAGTGVAADPVMAVRWLYGASLKLHVPAMETMGNYFEKGIGVAANEVQARQWRSASRSVVPVPVARRRTMFPAATPAGFRDYIAGLWRVEISLANGRKVTTDFRFALGLGTEFVLTADARSSNPVSGMRVWVVEQPATQSRPYPYKELHWDYSGRRFTGYLSGGALQGSIGNGGSWRATRRVDLEYYDLGVAALNQRRYEDGVYYFTQAIAQSADELYYSTRGNAYYGLYDYEPAIADYTESLRRAPQNFVTLFNRAHAHHYSGNNQAAVKDANQLLTMIKPDVTLIQQAAVHRVRALAYFDLGDSSLAAKDFAESRRLNPDQVETREEALAGIAAAAAETSKVFANIGSAFSKSAQELAAANKAQADLNAANAAAASAAEAGRIFAEGFKAYQAQDYGQAFTLFTQSAALGNTTAMFNLGVMFEQGQGTEKNFEQAVAWIEKAAAGGLASATPELLASYRRRLAFERGLNAYNAMNYSVALTEWKKSAELGDSSAMFNLSVMYEDGSGVESDPVTALTWLEKAAAAGSKQPMEETSKRLKARIDAAKKTN